MQPNNYYGNNQNYGQNYNQNFNQGYSQPPQSPQPPQYQYQQSTNIPAPKKANIFVPLTIILLITTIALAVFLFIDKAFLTPSENITETSITTDIFEPLSSLSIPDDENRNQNLAQALAGRIFAVNASFDQAIKFTSDEEYEYTYYRDPTTDYRKNVASINHGKFTIEGELIKLESGDVFRIVGDYLVKEKDQLSNNQLYIYFDNYQTYNTANGLNTALDNYFTNQKKNNPKLPTTEKSHIDIDSFVCKADYTKITNADSFYCNAFYTQYIGEKDATTLYKEAEYSDFLSYCTKDADMSIYSEGGSCYEDFSLENRANLIVRITNNSSYRISGTFRD